MPLIIRPADLRADRDAIVSCLRRYLSPRADEARYDWLYLRSPHGQASAWLAIDEARGEVVGVASAFPRRARLDGADTPGWVLGDFCIHDEYRTLGPALQLNRACLDAVAHGAAAFCYDFPSASMMAVYRRLRIAPLGNVARHSRILRWGRRLGRAVPVPGLREGVTAVASIVDLVPPRRAPLAGRLTVGVHDGAFGTEFDDLDRACRGGARLHFDRSAAHLNWRFREKPGDGETILAARDGAALRGFAAFAVDGDDAHLVDLIAIDDDATRALLDETARLAWRRGAVTLSTSLFASHALAPVLRQAGFRPREESPVILVGGPDLAGRPALRDGDVPLTPGDRES
ncbi:MAG TPA: hypothetical protein VFU59_03935 [Candidatus Eisenbacteria bacterium]|nr:hypothetical protein [Candidatus Eisenbacteria bacterium]